MTVKYNAPDPFVAIYGDQKIVPGPHYVMVWIICWNPVPA